MASKNRPNYAVGVDAGSARTRCVICIVEDQRLRFLGAGTAPSQGWHKGRPADPNKIAQSIQAAVSEAETRAKVLVESAVLGMGGAAVEADTARGVYEFGRPREITPDDLVYAVELASRCRLEDDRMMLHVFPLDFIIDGRSGHSNPVTVPCTRLEANVLLVTTSEQEHQCMIAAAQNAHLAVEDTAFEPVVSAYASVLPEERHRGAAVIDVGLDATGIVIYSGEVAAGAAALPVGGGHMTRDLVAGLHHYHGMSVTYDVAEMLKRDYGCAMLGLTNDSATVEVPVSDGRGMREIQRRHINELLEARAEEIFSYVRDEIDRAGMHGELMEGVFLTGGGARLEGMLDMAERTLNCHAKYGLVAGIQDWPQDFQNPAWTAVAGLAMYAARLKLQRSQRRRPPGLLGMFGI